MKLKRRERDKVHFNLTPLIDTVFLLLMFFMMTTTFNRQSELKIDLPEAKGEAVEVQDPVRILINERGEYAINDWKYTLVDTRLETLERALTKMVGDNQEMPLLISADKNAPHHAVMTAMEAVRNLGFSRLSFEAEQVVRNEGE